MGPLILVQRLPGAIYLAVPIAKLISRSRLLCHLSNMVLTIYMLVTYRSSWSSPPKHDALMTRVAADVFRRELPLKEVLAADAAREARTRAGSGSGEPSDQPSGFPQEHTENAGRIAIAALELPVTEVLLDPNPKTRPR